MIRVLTNKTARLICILAEAFPISVGSLLDIDGEIYKVDEVCHVIHRRVTKFGETPVCDCNQTNVYVTEIAL